MLLRIVNAVDRFNTLVGGAVSILNLAMTTVICWEIVARYVFHAPTIWAHDLSVLMFAWVGLLAGPYALRLRRHIAVDILSSRASSRLKTVLDLLGALLAIFFLLLVAVLGWQQAMNDLSIGARFSTEWAPPKALLTLAVPISAILLILQVLANLVRNLHLAATGKPLK